MKLTVYEYKQVEREVEVTFPIYYEYITGDYHENCTVGRITEQEHVKVEFYSIGQRVTANVTQSQLDKGQLGSLLGWYFKQADETTQEEFNEALGRARRFVHSIIYFT